MHPRFLVGFLFAFIAINLLYTDSKRCCLGARRLQTKDEDGLISDCTNTATSCSSVDCNDNKCQESTDTKNDDPETTCGADYCEVSGANEFCRLYYYEVRKCEPPCVDLKEGDGNKKNANAGEWWVRQECYVDLDGDVKNGCDFNHKIVHLDVMTRVTVEKDCYCSEENCTSDIGKACKILLGASFKTNLCDDSHGNVTNGYMMKKRDQISVVVLQMALQALLIFFIVP